VRTSPLRLLAVLAAVLAVAVAAPAAGAQTLAQRLDRALNTSGVSRSASGALALNLSSGRVAYARNPDKPFLPASNQKLPVTLAALHKLGPDFRIPTQVYGEGTQDGNVWRGRLVIKGFGDPTLSRADLTALALKVRRLGITHVTGGVRGDETYFDDRRTAPGWKPGYYKIECPPLTALIVDRGKVSGRTVDRPALAAAQAFRKALVRNGVAVMRSARLGPLGAGAVELARVRSPRIALIVRAMNRPSDNFYAEMLVKELGAYFRGKGTTGAGATVVRRVLRARKVPLAGIRIADGSGLSSLDRLTARALARMLVSARKDAAISAPFYDSLPIAGVNGTLKDRMRRGPARGVVRAKTGTTQNASALSGYVGSRWVFSILQNGWPVPWTSSRASQDRFAQILAGG
jgi:D-alanyl-D-alanine carboxypeptidase/D-alanyl-D-alanine-endopeptidase (penicillin-binding protein 4)